MNNIAGSDEALASLTLSFTQTGGTAAPQQDCNLTKIPSDLNVGTHNATNLSSSCSQAVTLVDGAIYAVKLRATDLAGNWADSNLANIAYDTSASVLQNFSTTTAERFLTDLDPNGPYGDGAVIDVTANFNEPIVAGSSMTVILENSAATPVEVLLNNINGQTLSGSFTVHGPRMGYDTANQTIRSIKDINVVDRAGNAQTDKNAISSDKTLGKNIAIDTGTPTLQSFAIVKEGTNNTTGNFKAGDRLTVTANYSKQVKVGSTISLRFNTSNGSESSQDINLTTVSANKISGTYVVANGDNVENLKVASIVAQSVSDLKNNLLSTTSKISISDYDAANALIVPKIDAVNNLGDGVQIDTVKPVAVSIEINKGQYNETLTNNTAVGLTLNATDTHLAKMQFSNDNVHWCALINAVTTFSNWNLLDLSCGGVNPVNPQTLETVYARFVDQAGNISDSVSDTITYDNTKPIIGSIVADKNTGVYGPGSVITFTATFSEDISDDSTMDATLNDGVGVHFARTVGQNQKTLTGVYTVGATDSGQDVAKLSFGSVLDAQNVFDLAGNQKDGLTRNGDNIDKNTTITIDTTAPVDNEITIDRSSEDGKVKVKLTPSDPNGINPAGMVAKVQMLSDLSDVCDFADVSTQKNIAIDTNPKIVSFVDDDYSSIKKACIAYTDLAGNTSNALVVSTPETPINFAYTDISNLDITPKYYAAFLTWQDARLKGTGGALEDMEVVDCLSPDSSDCVPGGAGTDSTSHVITYVKENPSNYWVYNERQADAKYCYRARFKNTNQDYSKFSETLCQVAGQGSQVSNTDVFITNNAGDINISKVAKTTAVLSFKTLDAGHNNEPLPTKAIIKLYTDKDLTQEVKTYNDTDKFDVNHAVLMDKLTANTDYYIKIQATDFSGKEKALNYSVSVNSNLTFTTLGQLAKITDITDPPAILSDTKVEINFNTDQEANCYIQYGTTSAVNATTLVFNDKAYDPVWALETTGEYTKKHSMHLTSLFPKQAYYYRIGCSDNYADKDVMTTVYSYQTTKDLVTGEEKLSAGSEGKFLTLDRQMTEADFAGRLDGTAPTISNISTSNIDGESATITWTTDEPANSSVIYNPTGATYSRIEGDQAVNMSISKYTTSHSVTIPGLIPDSKYDFSVMSVDASSNIAQSSNSTLTTKQPSSLSSIKVISTALGQATITWTTGNATTSTVEYGLTTAYGQTKQDNASVKEHSIILADLTPGSTYHFRVMGEDAQKNVFASSDTTFQPKAPPKIADFAVNDVYEHGATIAFSTNVATDALITFTDSVNTENSGVQGNPVVTSKHEIKLKDLASGETFGLKIKVRDEDGNETEETFQDFTTTKDVNPPKIDMVKTDTALTQNDKVQAIISWTTDELATGKIVYKEGKAGEEKTFNVNDAPSFSHIGVVTSFKPGTVYYFKVKSSDIVGNEATSTDFAVLTPKKRQNIIQIIIGNFTDIFGWAKFN